MDDLKRMLERKAEEIRVDPVMPTLVRRRSRSRRIGTVLMSTAVLVGLGIGGYVGARDLVRPGPRPGGGPSAGPSIGPTDPTPPTAPIPVPVEVHVLDAAPGLDTDAIVAYLDLVLDPEHGRYRVIGAEETEGSEVSAVLYQPGFEVDARMVSDGPLSGAELRPDRAIDTPLRIVIGEDFERNHGMHVRNLTATYDFMWARVRRQTERAESLLSEEAAGQFDRGEGGLDLSAYAERAVFEFVVLVRKGEATSSHVMIRQPNDEGYREVFETLTVGDGDGDGTPEVLSAERNR